MRQSHLFTKTRREAPTEEVSKNAKLLIQAGYVNKEMAGVYSYLPLGLRVLENIKDIIREEMNNLGGQEVLLTTLQSPEVWEKSGRWSDEEIDVWFKTKLANNTEAGLANTHEEPLTALMTHHINSYKDLPVYVYQIQDKFRNELRAKSGLMRGREFSMKDLYSFSRTQEELDSFYEECIKAYHKIFDRCGIGDITYRTFASGGSFSKFSDEFQAISDAGEDIIYIDKEKNIAVNKEVYTDEVLSDINLEKDKLVKEKAVEVGNIFKLGTKYSEALDLFYLDESGEKKPVIMGSYGIGVGRLMGAIVEMFADEKGIVWPKEIAPFDLHLIEVPSEENEKVAEETQKIYEYLKNEGYSVLYDDRNIRAGEKFGDADLMGMPTRLVVSDKTLKENGVEVKKRKEKEAKIVNKNQILKHV